MNLVWSPEKVMYYVVQADGTHRYLAALPTSQFQRKMFGSFKASFPNVPRANWKEMDFGPAIAEIMNQESHGSCVGHGAVGGFETCVNLKGRTRRHFSPVFVYSQINGGRDNGAVVGDSLDCLKNTGACLWDTQPGPNNIYKRDVPPGAYEEAKRFRVKEALAVDDFDELISAIHYGWVPIFGVEIGNNFNPDREGWVPGLQGSGGGHCMFAAGVRLKGGQPYALVPNSWGKGWGNGGRCMMPESYFQGYVDAYVIQYQEEDPLDPDAPPVAA